MAEIDYDDMDLLTTINPTLFYASSTPVINVPRNHEAQNLRRSTRARQSPSVTTAQEAPRKRTLSTSALHNTAVTNATKKIRLDEKKLVRAMTA
jgi:hypothetical protein